MRLDRPVARDASTPRRRVERSVVPPPARQQTAPTDVPNPGGADDTPDPRRWKALAVCLVGGFMVLLDVSIVNVALPSIRDGLGASESELQWVVSGYALTFGLLLVPAGRMGDVRGRRAMFVVALALFSLASLACGLAPTSLFLVVARLAQGLAKRVPGGGRTRGGPRRRPAAPADLGADPAAFPRPRARSRVGPLRLRGGPLDGGRPAAGRRAHRIVRRRLGLARGLLHHPAD